MYTQTNALIDKNRTTVVHRERLAFMAPELIIEELSIASAGVDVSSSEKFSFSKSIASVFSPPTITIFSSGAKICPPLVQLIGYVSALIDYMEM